MGNFIFLAIAGAAGTLARAGMTAVVEQMARKSVFPWATLTVNGLGSFICGIVFMLVGARWGLTNDIRFILMSGFLGAFTTFSAFSNDTVRLMMTSHWGLAAANVAVQVVLGLALFFAGAKLGKVF